MKRLSKPMRVFLGGVCALALACGAFAGWLAWASHRHASRARADSILKLASASSVEQLEEAVGYLGVVLRPQDGSWIAIRYTDSHSDPGAYSCSVALCSDGSWWVCGEHFCGRLSHYRSARARIRELDAAPGLTEGERREAIEASRLEGPVEQFGAIERAPSLALACSELTRLGFARAKIVAASALAKGSDAR